MRTHAAMHDGRPLLSCVLDGRVATPLPHSRSAAGWRLANFRVVSPMEARVGLVPASVFKTDDALREQRHGGFDSHALPRLNSNMEASAAALADSRTRLGPGRD